MSTKNFVSYGDAETVFTGVGNKLSAIKSKLTNKLDSSVYAQFGCKNLNAYPYGETTKTHYGITFTDNGDGSITVSGTNDGTDASFFNCHTYNPSEPNTIKYPNGKYILSGCPSVPGVYLAAQAYINGTYVTIGVDTGSGVEITLNGDQYDINTVDLQIRIVINKNKALSEPITFYPMIRPAGVADGTWEPYVKSNKQLTDGLAGVESGLVNKEPLGGATTGNKTFKVGGNLELRTDSEGGNINIMSDNNVQFEIDAHEGIFRVWSDKSGSYKFLTWNGNENVDLDNINRLNNYRKQNDLNLEVPDRKNILPMTVSGIKSANRSGTWNGNTYTLSTITMTIDTDSNGNVESVTLNGTGNNNIYLGVSDKFTANTNADVVLSGANIGANALYMSDETTTTDITTAEFTTTAGHEYVAVYHATESNYDNFKLYPMIRSATITDPTFVPYIPSVESRIEDLESGLDTVKSGLNDLVILETYSNQTSDIGGNIFIGNKTGYVPIAVQLTDYTATAAIQANPSFYPEGTNPQWLVNLQSIDGNTGIGLAANVTCSFNVWWMKVN